MKVVLYGTCQLFRIYETYLKDLDQFKDATMFNYGHYDFARKKLDLPLENIQTADIFMYQSLSTQYGIYSTENGNEGVLQFVKAEAIKISLPFFYLDVYPLHVYRDRVKCAISFEQYLQKYSLQEILFMFFHGELDFQLQQRFDFSIAHMKKKEKLCNVFFADFVEKYFTTVQLCSCYCHPTAPVYRHIVNQIYKCLNIPIVLDIFQEPFEFVHGESEPGSIYMKRELCLQYNLECDEIHTAKLLKSYLEKNWEELTSEI